MSSAASPVQLVDERDRSHKKPSGMRAVERNRNKRCKQSYKARRAANAIDQARKNGFAQMERVYRGIVAGGKKNFRNLTKRDLRYIHRYYKIAVEEERALKTFRKELLGGKSDEEKEELLESYLRVPVGEVLKLRKIDDAQKRAEMLEALMNEYSRESSGNKCGHNKNRFVDDLGHASPYDLNQEQDYYGNPLENDRNKKKHRRRPQVIYELIERFIFMALIPDKNLTVFFKKTAKKIKVNNACRRLIRSEGREGMIRVLIFMLLYTDTKSLRVGIPTNYDKTQFSGISMANIAKNVGMSVYRVRNALRKLEKQGLLYPTVKSVEEYVDEDGNKRRKYIRTQQVEKLAGGEWKGLAVVRVFTNLLFKSVGLDQRGANERKKPVFKRAKTREDYTTQGNVAQVDSDSADFKSAADILSAQFSEA